MPRMDDVALTVQTPQRSRLEIGKVLVDYL